jgi:hypothetical protein
VKRVRNRTARFHYFFRWDRQLWCLKELGEFRFPYDPGRLGPKFHAYIVLVCVFSATLFCKVFYVLMLTLIGLMALESSLNNKELKTKYVIISRHPNLGQNQNISVATFKYLGMLPTNQNDIHDEISSRFNLENACYYSVQNLCLLVS